MRIVTALIALTSAACVQSAKAATIQEYNRTTFQTALSSATLSSQTFDSLPLGTISTVNGVTYTPSLGTAYVTDTYLTTTSPNGLGSTSIGYFEAGETLTITFSSPITAFALDINTYAPTSGDYKATVNDGSNSVIPSILDVFPNTETGQFIGFTDSSSFTTVTIGAVADPGTGNAYSYTVDTLVYGGASAVTNASGTPEPSTFLLLGLGMSAAGIFRNRAKGRSASRKMPA